MIFCCGCSGLPPVDEPAFDCLTGFKPAAGALVLERDGRAWCVAPTGGFGGHEFTLPKAALMAATSPRPRWSKCSRKSGLRARLLSFVCDMPRKHTYACFFLAERIGGSQADLTWDRRPLCWCRLQICASC